MSPAPANKTNTVSKSRVNWVDAVKGFTILLVVLQHTTYGVADAMADFPGAFYAICKWAEPFRMPLFFLVAGLFAQKALKAPLRSFLDGKIIHFAYFYVLWTVIQIGLKIALPGGDHQVGLNDLALAVIEPFGLLWFIYCLALFFGVMRLARTVPPVFVYGVALALFFMRPHTGWMIPDEFAHRFVFFVSGVYLAQHIFTLATWADAHMRPALALSLTCFACTAFFVWSGMIENHLVEVVTSYTGAAATIMVIAVLSARGFTKPLSFVGSRSLAIYLAFFIPMAFSRVILIKLGFENADLVTALVYVTAVSGSLIAYAVTLKTPLRFLYVRPAALHLKQEAPLRATALSHA